MAKRQSKERGVKTDATLVFEIDERDRKLQEAILDSDFDRRGRDAFAAVTLALRENENDIEVAGRAARTFYCEAFFIAPDFRLIAAQGFIRGFVEGCVEELRRRSDPCPRSSTGQQGLPASSNVARLGSAARRSSLSQGRGPKPPRNSGRRRDVARGLD